MTRRVLVALDDGEVAAALLDAAVRLAARRRTELVGVYVEEAAVLESLALPFVRTFRDAARGWEAVEPGDLQRAFRVQAARLRHALERTAAHKRVRCTFTVRRGAPTTEIAASLAEGDVLIVGAGRQGGSASLPLGSTAAWLATRAETALLVLRPGHPGSVVAVFDGDTAVLAAASELAAAYDAPLRVVVPAHAPASAPLLADEARRWLGIRGIAGEVEALVGRDADERRRALNALHPGVAVVARGAAERQFGGVGQVLRDVPATWFLLPGNGGADRP